MSSLSRNGNPSKPGRPPRPAWRIVFWIVCAALCLSVTLFFVHTPGIDGLHSAMYGDQVYARAYRPFVLRALTPFVVRNLVRAVPDSAREKLLELSADQKKPYRLFLVYLDWDPKLLPEYLVGIGVMWGSLCGFMWAFRSLMRTTVDCHEAYYSLIPLLGLLFMPSYFAEYYCYLYDFPNLFLFTLGLAFLASGRWTRFLCLYPLSCLNRETTLLLSVVYVIHFGFRRLLPRSRFWGMLAYQAVVFLAIRMFLVRTFRDRPGEWLEFHLWRNVSEIQIHTHLFYCLFGILFVLGVTIPFRWRRKPMFLRDAFWIGFPLFGLDLLFGFLDELRAFYEVYPVALLLVIFTVGEYAGVCARKEREGAPIPYETSGSAPTVRPSPR